MVSQQVDCESLEIDASLRLLSKEFGFKLSRKSPFGKLKTGVFRALGAATSIGRSTPTTPPPEQPWTSFLPPEILDFIIDYLHDDPPSLRNCSLVCRTLVPASRFHLFRSILISITNFITAISLFTGSPHLAGCVRELTLEGDSLPFERLRELMDGKPSPVLIRVFMLVLAPKMRNVERLTLKEIPFDRTVVAMLAPNFPQLHTLSLFDCWFRSNADFDKLIRDHPLVHSVRCGRVSSLLGSALVDTQDHIGPQLRLRLLKMTEAYASSPLTIMPWLLVHSNPEQCMYSLYRLSQVTKLNHGLMELTTLKHLYLLFYRWRNSDVQVVINSPEVLTLVPRHPSTITTLTFDGKLLSHLLVIHALAQLDPHSFVHLKTVNVNIHVKEEVVRDEIPAEAWAGMDQTLSVLLSLQVVNITNTCTDRSHVEAGWKAIIERLPVLHARQVLTLHYSNPHQRRF